MSQAALTYRLAKLGILSEWQARNFYIQMNKDGSRTVEPDPMPRETSHVWKTVFQELWKDKTTKEDVAGDLGIPTSELDSMIFSLIAPIIEPSVGGR